VDQLPSSHVGVVDFPCDARQLGEDARHAYLVDRDVARAFDLQLRAFGANPRDPELAGNLAFLLLRVQPVQAESARQLAVHAIALAASQRRDVPTTGRRLQSPMR
jgi:hypothetical protein